MARAQEMHLYSLDTPSTDVCARLFGEEKGLLVCRPSRYIRPWFSIPEGCYAIVARFGKETDYRPGQPLWHPGFHWGPPWLKIASLVSMQSIVFNVLRRRSLPRRRHSA